MAALRPEPRRGHLAFGQPVPTHVFLVPSTGQSQRAVLPLQNSQPVPAQLPSAAARPLAIPGHKAFPGPGAAFLFPCCLPPAALLGVPGSQAFPRWGQADTPADRACTPEPSTDPGELASAPTAAWRAFLTGSQAV